MKKNKDILIQYIGLIMACMIMAVGLNMFLVPKTIAPGGLSGLSVVISKLTGFPVSNILFTISTPLLLFSVKILGKKDAIKTFIGMAILTLSLKVTEPLSTISLTDNTLLAAISGSILVGLSLGILFRIDASTGGTDLIALMLNRIIPSIPVSKCLSMIDGTVVVLAGVVNMNFETNVLILWRENMAAPRSGWSGALGEFSLSGSAVQKAAGLHGDEITVGHDDVVQQADVHGGQSVPHLQGGGPVLRRRQSHAAGMIVAQHHACGAGQQGVLHHLPDAEGGHIGAALGQAFAGKHLSLAVQTHLIQQLPALTIQQVHEVGTAALHGVEDAFGRYAAPGAALGRRHQIQQHGGILPDAGHLHQRLRRGLEHGVQRTEVLDQPVGQLVGVPAGDGIVQQQLQHLMIRQTVGSLLQEALPLALAMSVVQSHVCSPLPASLGNYSMTAAG